MTNDTFDITGNNAVQKQKLEIIGATTFGIIHDINNLLTVIINISDKIINGKSSSRHVESDVQDIINCARKMADMTTSLISFTRKYEPIGETVIVNQVVEDMARLVRRILLRKTVIITHYEPDLKPLPISRNNLEQILLNLIINARDALKDGGEITVTTGNTLPDRLHGATPPLTDHIWITVADNGGGMDASMRQRIFQPFVSDKQIAGTGFGMSIVKDLVQKNHGEIFCESKKNTGTVFTIGFPVVPPDKSIASCARKEKVPHDPQRKTVAVAETDETMRSILVEVLTREGFMVHSVFNREDIHLFRNRIKQKIDLLIVDTLMANMMELLPDKKMVMRNNVNKKLFLSGHPIHMLEQAPGLDDETGFLQKPFRINHLLKSINTLLRNE